MRNNVHENVNALLIFRILPTDNKTEEHNRNNTIQEKQTTTRKHTMHRNNAKEKGNGVYNLILIFFSPQFLATRFFSNCFRWLSLPTASLLRGAGFFSRRFLSICMNMISLFLFFHICMRKIILIANICVFPSLKLFMFFCVFLKILHIVSFLEVWLNQSCDIFTLL